MIPVLHDIFSKQYPSMLGAVYILNFGWVHAGLWGIVKPLLSKETVDRFLFLTRQELKNHVPIECIPLEYGGLLSIPPLLASNQLLNILASEDYMCTHPDLSQLYNDFMFEEEGSNSYQEDVWYDAEDASTHLEIITQVKSASDLQTLLHSTRSHSPKRVTSIGSLSEMNRFQSGSFGNLRNLKHRDASVSSSLFLGKRSSSPNKKSRPKLVNVFLNQVMSCPNPSAGFMNGLICTFLGMYDASPPFKGWIYKLSAAVFVVLGFVYFRKRLIYYINGSWES